MLSMRNRVTGVMACLIMCRGAAGADYAIELPQLDGVHGFAPYTTVDVEVQLPTEFSRIDGASLLLRGEHYPGLVVSVLNDFESLISAVLQLEDPPSDFKAGFYPYPYFFHELPIDVGGFDIELTIGSASPFEPVPNFQEWLDGQVTFRFSVGPPFINATMAFAVYPLVAIEHAELVISGQPVGVPEPASICLWMVAAALGQGVYRRRFKRTREFR